MDFVKKSELRKQKYRLINGGSGSNYFWGRYWKSLAAMKEWDWWFRASVLEGW